MGITKIETGGVSQTEFVSDYFVEPASGVSIIVTPPNDELWIVDQANITTDHDAISGASGLSDGTSGKLGRVVDATDSRQQWREEGGGATTTGGNGIGQGGGGQHLFESERMIGRGISMYIYTGNSNREAFYIARKVTS